MTGNQCLGTLGTSNEPVEFGDVLLEIANVGAGNAAGALSHLANRPFVVSVPVVAVLRPDDSPPRCTWCAGDAIVVTQRLVGELNGQVRVLLPLEQARELLALLSPASPAEDLHDTFGRTVLRQVAALLAAAYVAALRMFLGVRVAADLPDDVQITGAETALAAAAADLCEPVTILLCTAIHTSANAEGAAACVFFLLPQLSASLLAQRARALLG
jgi:chemotaxis protein CheY-P-specific phosphatase CheC